MFPLAIDFPNISPEIFSFEIQGYYFALRWYAVAYIIGILVGIRIMKKAISRASLWAPHRPAMTHDQVDSIAVFIIFGIIIGGRLGYVLFYQPEYYFANPGEIIKLWQGGMSFHGGLIGVTIGALAYANLARLPLLSTGDLLALAAPLGIFFVRVANFINAELWGRPSELPWAVIFPGTAAQNCPAVAGACARHPSQLYEALFEGLFLAILLWVLFRRGWLRTPGAIMGVFLAGYGFARFFIEFYRVADPQFMSPDNPYGHVIIFTQSGAGLTMGQVLTLPLIIIGLLFILNASPKFAHYTTPIGATILMLSKPLGWLLRGIDMGVNALKWGLKWGYKIVKFIASLPRIFEKK